MEETAESKEVQIKKLEATVKSLSEELIKVGGTAQTGSGCCQSLPNRKLWFFKTRLKKSSCLAA